MEPMRDFNCFAMRTGRVSQGGENALIDCEWIKESSD